MVHNPGLYLDGARGTLPAAGALPLAPEFWFDSADDAGKHAVASGRGM
jgi:hypothetical protein